MSESDRESDDHDLYVSFSSQEDDMVEERTQQSTQKRVMNESDKV